MNEPLIILILVLANGVFAGAEIAIVALRKNRIQELAQQGHGGARAVLTLRGEPERFLATVQVGITLVSASAAAYGGASIAARLTPVLTPLPFVGARAEAVALAIVVVGVSFLSIVIGELVPKSLALHAAERYALVIAKPLLWLSWLARPVVWVLSSSANLVLKPFGDRTTFTESRHSAEELQQLVEEAAKAGTIHPEAGEIASRALEMTELSAIDIMVPREDVVMVSRRATSEDIRRLLLTHSYSRLPVYEDRIDNVVGYVGIKDLLERLLQQKSLAVEEVMRPPFFVPESKGAVALLHEMRERRLPLATIVDEQGGTSGIVTLQDLLEELVGEIFSERAPQSTQLIEREASGSALVSGATPIREVNRALGLDLPDDGAWTTIAGLCLELAGAVPNVGQILTTPDGVLLEVVDASARRVRSVRVHAPGAPTSDDA